MMLRKSVKKKEFLLKNNSLEKGIEYEPVTYEDIKEQLKKQKKKEPDPSNTQGNNSDNNPTLGMLSSGRGTYAD
jgi:hypothetical protein